MRQRRPLCCASIFHVVAWQSQRPEPRRVLQLSILCIDRLTRDWTSHLSLGSFHVKPELTTFIDRMEQRWARCKLLGSGSASTSVDLFLLLLRVMWGLSESCKSKAWLPNVDERSDPSVPRFNDVCRWNSSPGSWMRTSPFHVKQVFRGSER